MAEVTAEVEVTKSPEVSHEAENEMTLQEVTDQLNIPTLGSLMARIIFGDALDEEKEDLFLTKEIDVTEPIQAEFVAKLSNLFEMNGIASPETLIVQAYGRKAGFTPKEKCWEYGMVVGIKEFQVIHHKRVDHVVSSGSLSPLFEIEKGQIPWVLPNRTKIKLPNGKGTIKARDYQSIIVWAFWDTYPELRPEVPEEATEGTDVPSAIALAIKKMEEANASSEDAKPVGIIDEALINQPVESLMLAVANAHIKNSTTKPVSIIDANAQSTSD